MRRARPYARLLIVGGALLAAGCSEASIDAAVQKVFKPRLTPQQYMLIAVSDSDPDMRREAVANVADSKEYDAEWAIKGFVAIALLESDTQSRCVAIRALAQTDDRRAVETALKILNHEDYPPQEVRPPDELCRWDAMTALGDLVQRGVVPEESRLVARDTMIMHLLEDDSRHVRTAAARGLALFRDRDALDALIAGLADREFPVVHQCELSLVALTGETFDCDPYRWKQWLEQHEADPFARAGYIPESRRAPYDGRMSKAWYETKQFFRWAFPGAKE
ncbi:MAG: hypothetical protein D6744_08165 [Planctomycetota bacterium]|nr:MAG: hypothetical protein D6744_08165 [Planctomycetota bacterium]